jgi:hypothetical protein
MNPDGNSFLVFFFCLVRCLVPVLLLLGISYLLRRLGWLPTGTEDEAGENHPAPRSK